MTPSKQNHHDPEIIPYRPSAFDQFAQEDAKAERRFRIFICIVLLICTASYYYGMKSVEESKKHIRKEVKK